MKIVQLDGDTAAHIRSPNDVVLCRIGSHLSNKPLSYLSYLRLTWKEADDLRTALSMLATWNQRHYLIYVFETHQPKCWMQWWNRHLWYLWSMGVANLKTCTEAIDASLETKTTVMITIISCRTGCNLGSVQQDCVSWRFLCFLLNLAGVSDSRPNKCQVENARILWYDLGSARPLLSFEGSLSAWRLTDSMLGRIKKVGLNGSLHERVVHKNYRYATRGKVCLVWPEESSCWRAADKIIDMCYCKRILNGNRSKMDKPHVMLSMVLHARRFYVVRLLRWEKSLARGTTTRL